MQFSFQNNDNSGDIKRIERLTGWKAINVEIAKGEKNGHKFGSGDKLELHGLEDYPQYNGEVVEISSIRKDGLHGKAYYFKTCNSDLFADLNWTYEYRLRIPNKPV